VAGQKDLGLLDLLVLHHHEGPLRLADSPQGQGSRSGDPHADRVGIGVGVGFGHHAVALGEGFGQDRRASGLHRQQARQAVDQAHPLQVPEALAQSAHDAAIAHRHCNVVGNVVSQVLPDLQGGGLLAFQQVGVEAGVAVVPSELLGGPQGQFEGVVIGAPHRQNGGSEHQQLGHLGPGGPLGNEDHRAQPHRGAHPRKRRGGVAGGGRGDQRLAGLQRGRGRDGAGPVLQGPGGVLAIVLDGQPRQSQDLAQARGLVEGGAADPQGRQALRRADRQDRRVARQSPGFRAAQGVRGELGRGGLEVVEDLEEAVGAAVRARVAHVAGGEVPPADRAGHGGDGEGILAGHGDAASRCWRQPLARGWGCTLHPGRWSP